MITLRSSSLQNYAECQRMFGAWFMISSGLAREYNLDLREPRPHVGAHVGTGTHAGAAYLMEEFAKTGEQGDRWRAKQASDIARFKTDELCSAPTLFDPPLTPTTRAAVEAAAKITERIHLDVVPDSPPLLVEKGYKAIFKGAPGSDDYQVTGTFDTFLIELALWDFKTGKMKPRPMAQMGSYSNILRSNGFDVNKVAVKFGARPSANKPAKPIEHIDIDLPEAERHAKSISRQAARSMQEMLDSGDPEMLVANPGCLLCSPDYCPAWGTKWCKVGRPKK